MQWHEKQHPLAQRMVDDQLAARGINDARVLAAMRTVPRHRFVPDLPPGETYADRALPTAEGQTISQPYMVALMSQLLAVEPGMKALEIGTGSGYQCAILAELGAKVISIERAAGLAQRAMRTLDELGYRQSVEIHVADGTLGWPAAAPYDRILVTAGAPRLPPAYRQQIADGGRIVIPIGGSDVQQLIFYERRGSHLHETRSVGCRFVPLVGAEGWPVENIQPPMNAEECG